MPESYPALPCFPCPHSSNCCSWGVTLSEAEAEGLGARYGTDKVYRTRWGEWRTRIKQRRCVFLVENACTIHKDPQYPEVCRAFPWTDAETGGPYEYDQTICPEFLMHPEYVQIGKPAGRRSGG